MINCDSNKELMSDYLENEIEAEMKNEVVRHLAVCPACSLMFQKARILITKLTEMNNMTVSVGFDGNMAARLADIRRHPNSKKMSYFIRGAAVGAATAGVLFVGMNGDSKTATDVENISRSSLSKDIKMTAATLDSVQADSLAGKKPGNLEKRIKLVNDH